MLHFCGALFLFLRRDRFINPCHNPACPAGGMSFRTTRQGGGDVVENIDSTEGTITAMDRANFRHGEVTTATRTKIEVVVGPLTTVT